MKRFLGPVTLIFLGIWLVLMVGGRSRFFQDPGTFWHVAVGNRIIDTGFFDTDPYTFTFADKPWIPHQWLGECTMAVLHRIGGFDTLLLATATLLAGVYTGLGVRLLRCGLHPSVVAVVIAFAVAASSGHFHVRPHLATIAGMAVFVVYLTDVDNGRISINRLLWLVPVTCLWANIHGGVLGGLATFALAIAGWTLSWQLGRETPVRSRGDLGRLILIWLGCVAVCFANPYFGRLPAAWLEIYEMKSLPLIIKEHSRLDVTDWTGQSVIAFGLLYGVLLVTIPMRQWRVSWLLPMVWFGLACMRVRHAPLFAVAGLVGIADMFPATRIAAALLKRKSDLFAPGATSGAELARDSARPFAVPAGLVLVALLSQAVGATVPVIGREWAQLDPTIWPVELVPELREHQDDRPKGTRIFCEYSYGGFLIYHAPGYRVFIDDRCELFGDEFLVQFEEAKAWLLLGIYENPAEPFAEWQATYGSFDFALVETGKAFDQALSELPQAWEVVRQTDTATLYRKKPSPR
jgi:drug/metabolite transporter superfamily protein YnfA